MYIPAKVPKFIRDRSTFSVRQIEHLCRTDRVRLVQDGQVKTHDLLHQFVFDDDVVLVDGKPLKRTFTPRLYVMNKPKGVTVTASDPDGKRDLSGWLRSLPAGVFPVGRLDRETTGVLLLTNDGDLMSALMRPEHRVEKSYWLWLNESLERDDERLATWTTGMMICGRHAFAERVVVERSTQDMTELHVVLSQGINRQIRRMCRVSDFRLLHLHRRAIGPVTDAGLSVGEVRELGSSEIEAFWSRFGGKERMRELKIRALLGQARDARRAEAPLVKLERWLLEHGALYRSA